MAEDGEKKAKARTLRDEDFEEGPRRVGRRRMFGVLGAGAATAAIASGCGAVYVDEPATVPVTVGGYTDNDAGYRADAAGYGRGPTGVTDGDAGQCADPVNYGVQGSGITDSDGGNCADRGGSGRRGT